MFNTTPTVDSILSSFTKMTKQLRELQDQKLTEVLSDEQRLLDIQAGISAKRSEISRAAKVQSQLEKLLEV